MRHITISGDIGSGKTTVTELLSQRLHWQVVRAGEIQRSMASSSGLTTLEANRLAETKKVLDEEIDNRLVALSTGENELIFDSRMAWHLIPKAFKVHLIADPEVAALRLLGRCASAVECYNSLAEAKIAAEDRYQSERRRFTALYSVDISLLRNYDLIVDTSDAPPGMIVDEILSAMADGADSRHKLQVSPCRVRRVDEGVQLLRGQPTDGIHLYSASDASYPRICYLRPTLIALYPNAALDSAIALGRPLMPALLAAEGEELTSLDSRSKIGSYSK